MTLAVGEDRPKVVPCGSQMVKRFEFGDHVANSESMRKTNPTRPAKPAGNIRVSLFQFYLVQDCQCRVIVATQAKKTICEF